MYTCNNLYVNFSNLLQYWYTLMHINIRWRHSTWVELFYLTWCYCMCNIYSLRISARWSEVRHVKFIDRRKLYKLTARHNYTENSILFMSSSEPLSNKWKACLTAECVSAHWMSLSVWVHTSIQESATPLRTERWNMMTRISAIVGDRDCNFKWPSQSSLPRMFFMSLVTTSFFFFFYKSWKIKVVLCIYSWLLRTVASMFTVYCHNTLKKKCSMYHIRVHHPTNRRTSFGAK